MPLWTLVGVVVAVWFVAAVLAGLAIGAMIRRRDRQVASGHDPDPVPEDTGPDDKV